MKKNVLMYSMVLGFLILFGIYYSFNVGHPNFYSSICGSGMNGIRHLAIYYLPLLLGILIIILIYRYKHSKKKCRYCNLRIDKEFNICPYCGNSIGEDSA